MVNYCCVQALMAHSGRSSRVARVYSAEGFSRQLPGAMHPNGGAWGPWINSSCR